MKNTLLLLSLCCLSVAYAQTPAEIDAALYDFRSDSATVTTTATIAPENARLLSDDTSLVDASSEDALLIDAQTLIKDKLIEKYQVRLDKTVAKLSEKLSTQTADVQRQVLISVRDKIVEKKTLVLAKTQIDPLKRDITVTILDHLSFRIDGLLKQAAQLPVIQQSV